MNKNFKESIKKDLRNSLKYENEIKKIIIFGSFLQLENPSDIDVAIFQDSDKPYLELALKYRRLTRNISKKLPIDIIPIRSNPGNNPFLAEIESGELIYER